MDVKNRRVWVIGGSVLDVIAGQVSPDIFSSTSMSMETIQMHCGGNGLNEAINLANLCVPVTLHTNFGSGQSSLYLQQTAQRHHITCSLCQSQAPGSINVILVDETGERHILSAAGTALRKVTLPETIDPAPWLVCLSDLFASEEISIAKAAAFMKQMKEQNVLTMVDTTRPKHQERAADLASLLVYTDYFLTSWQEGAALTGCREPAEILKTLLEYAKGMVIVKLGSKGVMAGDGKTGRMFHLPALESENPVDSTGCGDAFAAGLIAGLYAEKPFCTALAIAMAAGYFTVEYPGAQTGLETHGKADLQAHAGMLQKCWQHKNHEDSKKSQLSNFLETFETSNRLHYNENYSIDEK